MKDFGLLISELRKDRRISQDELASLLGCTKQTISNYERSRRKPDYETLEAIADIFNVPMGFFLSEDEQKAKLEQIYKTYNVLGGISHNESRSESVTVAGNTPQGISPKALMLAKLYDSLDEYGQHVVDTIAQLERNRLPRSVTVNQTQPHMIPHIGTLNCTGEIETRHAAEQERLEMQNEVECAPE